MRGYIKKEINMSYVKINSGTNQGASPIKGCITKNMSSRHPEVRNAGLALTEFTSTPKSFPTKPTVFWGSREKYPIIKIEKTVALTGTKRKSIDEMEKPSPNKIILMELQLQKTQFKNELLAKHIQKLDKFLGDRSNIKSYLSKLREKK